MKIGTSSLLRAEQQTLNLGNLARVCETVKTLHSMGEIPTGCLAEDLKIPSDGAARNRVCYEGRESDGWI